MASGGDVVTQVRAVQRDTLATRQAANIFPHDFLKPAFKVAKQVESSLGEAPHRGRMASRAQRTPVAKLIKASRRKLHSVNSPTILWAPSQNPPMSCPWGRRKEAFQRPNHRRSLPAGSVQHIIETNHCGGESVGLFISR